MSACKSLASLGLALLTPFLLAGCLGGSGGGNAQASAFGVTVCSLGCGGSSFAVTTWQANKDIIFTFSDEVDPFSVNFSSISILDSADGAAPLGSFLVEGNRVTFRPALIETSGGLTFGFTDGRTYRVELPSSGPNVVRSRGGRTNSNVVRGSITIDGIADLVPGPPVVVSVDPNDQNPPTTQSFSVRVVFGDLLRTAQLADPETGESALVTVAVADSGTGNTSVVPGSFSASINRDALTTTLVFTPLIGYPAGDSGRRVLQVNLSQQIVDLVGNPLAGAGILAIPLAEGGSASGSIVEDFDDAAQEDGAGSTSGLWAGIAGVLDSGQDPLTGRHRGGGSGVLGRFDLDDEFVQMDTDSYDHFSDFLNETVTITGGVFPFEEVRIGADATLLGIGSNPLRLWSRGLLSLATTLDADGESAPPNYGKCLPEIERNLPEPTSFTFTDEFDPVRDEVALGGEAGVGRLSGGSGGQGGISWYGGDDGMGFELGANQYYFDTANCGWRQVEDGTCPSLQPNRFRDTYTGDEYCGANGDRVGGVAAQGGPTTGPGANKIDEDLDAGSGMGSWAWPPKSNVMPNPDLSGGVRIKTHVYIDNGTPQFRENHARHRARGGGGAGYWTAGERGEYFVPGSVNPLGVVIDVTTEPIVNVAQSIREFNGDGLGADYMTWDSRAGANSRPVLDAEGGDYVKPFGMETLDPDLGFLLGGAGGGGAGNNQHGSWKETPTLGQGDIDTFRCGDGAGGGGGSGGAILLQASGALTLDSGSVLVAGGAGGLGSAGNHGGAGGSGVVRIESAVPLNLAEMQDVVEPDESVDLTPVGFPGLPNSAVFSASWPGSVGDVTAGDGTVFNGNSSGVRSRWYEAPAQVNQITVLSWTVECEYLDGGGVQTLTFDSASNPTDPESTPIWIAMQAAWMQAGESQEPDPELVLSTDWVIPGFETVTNGLEQLGLVLARAVRFTVVFDHDAIAALIGGTPGGYFRVKSIQFDWEGS